MGQTEKKEIKGGQERTGEDRGGEGQRRGGVSEIVYFISLP